MVSNNRQIKLNKCNDLKKVLLSIQNKSNVCNWQHCKGTVIIIIIEYKVGTPILEIKINTIIIASLIIQY